MKNNNLDLVMITKGEKFPIDMSNMPNEVVIMDFVSSTNPEIFIKFRHLTSKEKKDYGNGSNIEFRYYTAPKREYGLLLIKFGSVVQEFIEVIPIERFIRVIDHIQFIIKVFLYRKLWYIAFV